MHRERENKCGLRLLRTREQPDTTCAPECPWFLPPPHFQREELWPERAVLTGWLQGAEEVAPGF